ncbi:hypothetical protein HELRODRAFT_85570 [Helobdella robusta]|uniref:Uncharacterized protein n=1 Tax=Helobdella robusta TaxID=6412 RepID=T1G5Z7_HELRO|nr:hypothetical protein HELRODRAFT_85570 [Helobdella robusta]ESN97144.1 hypothetical protein HELRODRAFT_85570 [Helobdella robusta]
MKACKSGKVQHVELLLYYGSDPNKQNCSGNTPLHICAINNQVYILICMFLFVCLFVCLYVCFKVCMRV